MQKLLIASGNAGKVREFRALLSGMDLELIAPEQVNLGIWVDESGSTYGQNAAHKAQVYAQASQLVTLADDSGLEVDALNGLPGVHSRRFSPQPDASDADRRRRLLHMLNQHLRPWTARFRCVVAIATPNDTLHLSEGTCSGEIIPEERGTGGFGYDPIFFFPKMERTLAELSMEEKNLISHRSRAVQAARPVLKILLGTT